MTMTADTNGVKLFARRTAEGWDIPSRKEFLDHPAVKGRMFTVGGLPSALDYDGEDVGGAQCELSQWLTIPPYDAKGITSLCGDGKQRFMLDLDYAGEFVGSLCPVEAGIVVTHLVFAFKTIKLRSWPMDVLLVESSTPGCWHVYSTSSLDMSSRGPSDDPKGYDNVAHYDYTWWDLSRRRGYAVLRLPWVEREGPKKNLGMPKFAPPILSDPVFPLPYRERFDALRDVGLEPF